MSTNRAATSAPDTTPASTNRERFDEAIQQILITLSEQFPIPMDIKDETFHLDTNEREAMYFHTLVFLRNEGVIRCNPITSRDFRFTNVSLTAKGLDLLTKSVEPLPSDPPNAIRRTLADLLTVVGREAAKQVGRNLMDYLVNHGHTLIQLHP
jgi:hypothetical protein